MKKNVFSFLLLATFAASLWSHPAHALGLKVAPLDYTVTLQKGEKQKGFIDLSNPTGTTLRVKTSVQVFRQTDDRGSLTFFDKEQVSAGVLPDLDEFELGPREAIRMYFLVDGTKLPQGDTFAAIFFTTIPTKQGAGVTQLVRLGTLLNITNGTPGPRNAEITELDVPFIQLGDKLTGTYRVRNTADAESNTGFYPKVTVSVDPFYKEIVQRGRLVFAGRTRENAFELPTARLGFYKVTASYGDSSKEQWVFMVSGGQVVVFGVVIMATIAIYWIRKKAKKKPVDNLRINR